MKYSITSSCSGNLAFNSRKFIAFKLAEEKLKTIEREPAGVIIPAINELRYVGYHILGALTATPADETVSISKAENHCKRAIYDSMEMGIILNLEKIETFHRDYRKVSLLPLIPEYLQKTNRVREIRDFIDSVQDRETREQHYERITEFFTELKIISNLFEDAAYSAEICRLFRSKPATLTA